MPNNCLSVLYTHIIQVENKNVGLKVCVCVCVCGGGGGAQTYHCPPKNSGGGGLMSPLTAPPPPIPTPVYNILNGKYVCIKNP